MPIRRASLLAEQLGQLHEAMTEEGNLSTMLHRLSDSAGALQAAERAIDLWRRQGEPGGVTSGAVHMRAGVYYLSAGRYADALAAFELALPMFGAGQAGVWANYTEHHLARLWLALGQTARAQRLLSPLPADAPHSLRNKRLMVLARIARQTGKLRAETLSEGLVFTQDVYGPDRFDAQLMLASVLPPADALSLCDELLPSARHQYPAAAKHAHVRRADCLRRLGRHAEAAAAAREALAMTDTTPLELTPPEFWWLVYQALDAADAGAEAQAVLQTAMAWLDAAQRHVPPEFLESFRQRNPEHRALLLRGQAVQPSNA